MRCDERVFRCAPMYSIVLRVLRASLASSRSYLLQHLQTHVKIDQTVQLGNDIERESMCRACIALQVSIIYYRLVIIILTVFNLLFSKSGNFDYYSL